MRAAEKRLVLTNRLAFVVEDRPAAAHPARLTGTSAVGQARRLGLDLLLDLAPKAVGVGEAMLNLGLLARFEIGGMCLARHGVDDGGLRLRGGLGARVGEQIVGQTRRGACENTLSVGERI